MRRLILMCLLILTALPSAAWAESSWWDHDFSFRKSITIDTTAAGANLAQPAGRVPLLIRLHSGNFQFDGTTEAGTDIRFIAADDKTPLNFQIESFDPVLGVALIWVDVPSVGSASQQTIWMYYGNSKAPAAGKGSTTFDADYSLVYHFDGVSGPTPKDATGYANDPTSGSVRLVDGIMGKAAQFDGNASLALPGSASLNTTAGGAFSLSTWLKVDAVADGRVLIYARRQNGKSLLVGLDRGVPFVEVDGDAVQRTAAGKPIEPSQWTHVAVAAGEGKVHLYINGQPYADIDAALPAFTSAAAIGGDVAADAAAPADAKPFVGQLDELRISRIARSPLVFQVDAATQGADSKMVQYGVDEKQAGIGFGYFGIIVKSVTVDAWVIIGILVLLAMVSWAVMWQRAAYVNRVSRANEVFIEHFRGQGSNILGLAGDTEAAGKHRLADSSLFRLYKLGATEVWSRRDEQGRQVITAESIEAIRATMDSRLVRENQQLAKSMVWLTLAISGGPFIGLLGTVVGVMITFAAIAAAGDVNVNAIAPGIAAALLATVAGMFVAIPALFGYNYLLIRNKNVTANMQVFVDEFVTRLAETQRHVETTRLAG